MALSEVWTARFASELDSRPPVVPVWAESRPLDVVVPPLPRDFGGEEVQLPAATRTVRIRWVPNLSVATEFIDPYGSVWLVDGWRESGRRQWLDIGISRYASYSGLPPTGDFLPPAGWQLVDGDGVPVRSIPITHAQRATDAAFTLLGYQSTVPAGGYATADGETWATPADGWKCGVGAIPLWMKFFDLGVATGELPAAEGARWPAARFGYIQLSTRPGGFAAHKWDGSALGDFTLHISAGGST